MTVNLEHGNLILRLWFMIHHTHDMLKACEDRVFGEHKLTAERYMTLVTIKYLNDPVRPTDVAKWLARSVNSVSMIIDRMVKAGLVRRVRDRADRRVVRLTITNKGEEALKPATLAGWKFIQEIMSPLSYEDKQTVLSLLLATQYGAHKYLKPEEDIEELKRTEAESHDNLLERMSYYLPYSTPKANVRVGRRERPYNKDS
jgi:DNA-binding MarR family transcriptional regulator